MAGQVRQPARVAVHIWQDQLNFLFGRDRFTSYRAAAASGFTALNAPGRRAVTQEAWPGGVSLRLAHGNVNGIAFDGTSEDAAGPIHAPSIHTDHLVVRRGSQTAGFEAMCHWIGPDGEVLLEERRTASIRPGSGESRILDLSFRLAAPFEQAVTFGRTEEAFLMVRAASALFPAGGGQARNSVGDYGAEAIHGRSAAWVACVGVVQAETVGFAFLDHPDNPWHPPPWVAREDGTLSPSPFAWRVEELAAGRAVLLRYRLIVHRGYVDQGWADARLAEYVREA
ncbi:MAG TPA: DUF6807 family protein [Chthonomonadaceae bacterium]|nr:DUF6807 family protein [Chthonomonadaceae bacterium]